MGCGGNEIAIGLAFNPVLARFVAQYGSAIDYLELSPERFWRDSGPALGCAKHRYTDIREAVAQLEAVRGQLPLVAHGVGLSIATTGELDVGHVEQILRYHRRFHFLWYSEHLAYFRLGATENWRGVGVMLPPVYDEDTLTELSAKVTQVNDAMGIPFLLENAVNYAPVPDADLSDAAFLRGISSKTPAYLLLDLHNLHTDAENLGTDPFELVEALDLNRVHELHIAGGERWAEHWTDAHSGSCPSRVWQLLAHVLSKPNGVRAITFELDESYAVGMPDAELLNQLLRARSVVETAGPWRTTSPQSSSQDVFDV